jgi:hypothetical protein
MEIKYENEKKVVIESDEPIHSFDCSGFAVVLSKQPVKDVKILFDKKKK